MKYLILGASAAGINAAKELRKLDKESSITMISVDKNIYSRCMLHLYVSGERDLESMKFINEDYFERYNINWVSGAKVIKLDPIEKVVYTNDGSAYEYDKVLIATGSEAIVPSIRTVSTMFVETEQKLSDATNVGVLRTIEDADYIKELASKSKHAIVVGGGLIGVDIASELTAIGLEVHVVEAASHLLALQLDERAAYTYERALERRNATVSTGKLASRAVINEENKVISMFLSDGNIINTDMVIVTAGVKPNDDFLKDTDILRNRGIVVNNKGETSVEDVYAAGDVCANKAGIWPLAIKEGIVAASNMAGVEKFNDNDFVFKNSVNLVGVQTISMGFTEAPDDFYQVDILDDGETYKKVIHKHGIIVGAIFQKDIDYSGVYAELIKQKINIDHINKSILDLNYADFYKLKDNYEFEFARK